ncbi:hypothetical protein [Coleofasciculus sp.]|uniref:hypothetical protein n=1 Tax=Coleofasciculus sp. TaxID=3100458 RepID=UPI003A38BF3B
MQVPPNKNLRVYFFNAFAARQKPLNTQILVPEPRVQYECSKLGQFLATMTPIELTAYQLRYEIGDDLLMLTPEAFLYFLPAFLYLSLKSYESVDFFVDVLISTLTKPSRPDIVEKYDYLAKCSPGLPDDMLELLREQQLESFDSGESLATFHERFDSLTSEEGKAVLAFLVTLKEYYNKDFPFGELDKAIDRHWIRYETS